MKDSGFDFIKEKQLFFDLFKNISDSEKIIWKDNSTTIGVSIVKEYPDNTPFVPIKTKDGANDSIALIQVGFYLAEISENHVPLIVTINKASRYLFDHMFYEYTDDKSPSEESVATSNKSPQPIGLKDKIYVYDLSERRLFDKKSRKTINPEELVDKLYKQHIKTITTKSFRIKMDIQKLIVEGIDPFNDFLLRILQVFFGKKIHKSSDSKDIFVGSLEPYNLNSLADIQTISEKSKLFGTEFPVTTRSAYTFVILMTLIFFLNYYFKYDLLGLVSLLNSAHENTLFLISLVSSLLILIDRVTPFFVLLLINSLIRFKLKLMFIQISIK